MSTRLDQVYLDFFTTALEGGISYWSATSSYRRRNPDGTDNLLTFKAAIVDEQNDDKPYTINRDVIALGAKRIMDGSVECAESIRRAVALTYFDSDDADFDAETADCIVQAGLFNEIVYG